jgi:hypothetical protein
VHELLVELLQHDARDVLVTPAQQVQRVRLRERLVGRVVEVVDAAVRNMGECKGKWR